MPITENAANAMTVDTGVALGTVFTMFIVLCVGYIARRTGIIDDAIQKGLSNIIIKIGQPFMIIAAVLEIEYSTENLNAALIIIAIALGVHIVSAVIARTSTIPFKDQPGERKISEFAILFANCGFMGFPVLRSMFGDIGAFWGAFYVVVFNIVQWTYGMTILGRDRDDIRPNLKKMFINYGTTPCLIGLALFLLRIPTDNAVVRPIVSAMDYLGSLCTPISMLIVGALLAKLPMRKMFARARLLYYCAVKLLFLPLCVLAVGYFLPLPTELKLFAVIMACLPSASNTVMFGESYDIYPEYAAQSIALSTFLSALTIPIILLIATALHGM